MTALGQDLRHGARLLVKSPGFTLAAIGIFTLGIGANTAIFSVVNAVLLRPLPFPDSARLVRVWHTPPAASFPGMRIFAVSPANYLDWERQNHVFEKMALIQFQGLNLTGGGEPESVAAAQVSSDFFSVLGARPALGRTFTREEYSGGPSHVVVLGHSIWKTRFGADPGIVGSEIRLDDQPWRVVGVMGPDIRLPDFSSVWVPMEWDAKKRAQRANHNALVVARLKPEVDLARAKAEMNVISDRLARQYPEDNTGWGAVVIPLHEDLVGEVRPTLLILLGAVAFVLLIACANVVNLALARTLARRKEIAVRSALGASRGRLLRQLMAETLLLSLAGGALGLFLASYGVDGIVAFLADQLPRSSEVHLDAWVLAFTLAISVATGVVAGFAPAWRLTKGDIADSLKQGLGRTDADSGGQRTRNLLVVSEVALSLVLLVGAGLLIRSLWLLRRVDPGFDSRGVVTMSVGLPRTRYSEPGRQSAFFDQALEKIRALPGVEAAGAANTLPLTDSENWPIAIEGRPLLPVARQPIAITTVVAGDYFRALRIPLRRGRLFSREDRADAPTVAVISESMAKRFWPGEDAIGRRLTAVFLPDKICQVVGIVGDVKLRGLDYRDSVPAMYLTHAQAPGPGMEFTIRAGTSFVASAAVAAIHEMDPDQPVLQVGTMEQILAGSLSRQRLTMLLLAAFAGVALILAAVGIYSVLAYGVRRRGREIGIRMALGARPADIMRMMLFQGMSPALFGLAIGLGAALVLGRVLSGLIFGVSAYDPATFAAVAVLLCVVALIACLAPARRATRVDPLRAIREE